MPDPGQVTRILQASRDGDPEASQKLLVLVYDEVKALARNLMRRERGNHTLQPTALVHEAWLRLVQQEDAAFKDRGHFLTVAASVIRRLLIDHARRKAAGKRGAGAEVEELPFDVPGPEPDVDLLALDEALRELEACHPRQKRIVELRYFVGLTIEETAEALAVSPSTVKAEWAMARAWLHRQLED